MYICVPESLTDKGRSRELRPLFPRVPVREAQPEEKECSRSRKAIASPWRDLGPAPPPRPPAPSVPFSAAGVPPGARLWIHCLQSRLPEPPALGCAGPTCHPGLATSRPGGREPQPVHTLSGRVGLFSGSGPSCQAGGETALGHAGATQGALSRPGGQSSVGTHCPGQVGPAVLSPQPLEAAKSSGKKALPWGRSCPARCCDPA